MVGRVACPLSEEDLVRACTFRRSGLENEMVKEVKEESCQRRESEESGFGEDETLWPDEDDSFMCEASIPGGAQEEDGSRNVDPGSTYSR